MTNFLEWIGDKMYLSGWFHNKDEEKYQKQKEKQYKHWQKDNK